MLSLFLFDFLFYLTTAGHVAAVERLSVLHHSADYIFISFRIIGSIGIFENGVLLMYTQDGVPTWHST